jgi:hypothetical protein
MDGLPQPSQLPDPRDRRETEAWLENRSEKLAEAIAKSLKKVVTSAYSKFLATLPETSIVSSLTAAGDLHAFDGIVGDWKLIFEREIAPEIEESYLSGAMSAFTQAPGTDAMSPDEVAAWARVTNDQAVSYMADATNRLTGVGETIWSDVRERVTSAVASGMSNEELKDQIEKLADFSEYRADTIARTETIGAYVNGDWQGAQLLGEFGPVEKVWVATGDARGREWHTDMMSESIPIDEPFDVDGEPMMYPHDPSGSAFNVVNCRCYVEFLYPGDTRPDGSVIPEPGTGDEGEEALEEIADEELPVPEVQIGGEFVPGQWVEITPEMHDQLVDTFVQGNSGRVALAQRTELAKQLQATPRVVVNGDVLILDVAGVNERGWRTLLESVDELRVANPQSGQGVVIRVLDTLPGSTPNALADATMGYSDKSINQLRFKKSVLEDRRTVKSSSKRGWWQATATDVTVNEYTIAHEWGHIVDKSQMAMTGRKVNKAAQQSRLLFVDAGPLLSEYGRYNELEGYAESFADFWTSRGKSTNPATQAYAKAFGWRL